MNNGYRKFSSKFVGDGDKPKSFPTFATFTDGDAFSNLTRYLINRFWPH